MAMDKATADAYIYAKASGVLARSYVGKRAALLFESKSLGELWSKISKKEIPAVPEALLAKALEKEALRIFIADYKKLVETYSAPEELLISLLEYYDYENLKDFCAELCMGEKTIPDYTDIKPYNLLDYGAWPNLKKMTAPSKLSWCQKVPELLEQKDNDHALDLQYIQQILSSVKKIKGECRGALENLVTENYRMQNVLWALRLKIYYKMNDEEILGLLAYSDEKKSPNDPLAGEAVKVLSFETDNYSSWKNWKYAELLNPHVEGEVWSIDPRWLTNSFRNHYVKKAYRLFHQFPFSPCPLVCYFILKREELDNIRTASESLRLSIDSREAMMLAGIQEVKNG